MAGLVHGHVDPRGAGWRFRLPLWPLHHGLEPSQVSLHSRQNWHWNNVERVVENRTVPNCCCHASKEICEANTTIMCAMCEDSCGPWTLSDSCVYAKVSARLKFLWRLGISGLFSPNLAQPHRSWSSKCKMMLLESVLVHFYLGSRNENQYFKDYYSVKTEAK